MLLVKTCFYVRHVRAEYDHMQFMNNVSPYHNWVTVNQEIETKKQKCVVPLSLILGRGMRSNLCDFKNQQKVSFISKMIYDEIFGEPKKKTEKTF